MLPIPIINNIFLSYLLNIREYLVGKLLDCTMYYFNNNEKSPFQNKKIKQYIEKGYKKCELHIKNNKIYEKYTNVYDNKIEYDFIIENFINKNKDKYLFLLLYKFMMFIFYLIGVKYTAIYDMNNELIAITLCINCRNVIYYILYYQNEECKKYNYYQFTYGKIFNTLNEKIKYISYGAGTDHLKRQISNYTMHFK